MPCLRVTQLTPAQSWDVGSAQRSHSFLDRLTPGDLRLIGAWKLAIQFSWVCVSNKAQPCSFFLAPFLSCLPGPFFPLFMFKSLTEGLALWEVLAFLCLFWQVLLVGQRDQEDDCLLSVGPMLCPQMSHSVYKLLCKVGMIMPSVWDTQARPLED